MIKRIRFARLRPGATPEDWRDTMRREAEGGVGAAPLRVVVCEVLSGDSPDALHDGVGIEWFTDADHLARCDEWAAGRRDEVLDGARSPFLLAEESVMRGADWLARRWRSSTDVLKHMALARRAAGLTSEEFSARWRSRAGTLGSAAGPVLVIPERAKGQAYIQNHVLPVPPGGWPYDAVNEVYFDDIESLRYRLSWFTENMSAGAENDLVSTATFLALRESLVLPLR